MAALANYLRGWAVNGLLWGNGGALRPAFRADYQPNRRWDVNGEFAWSSGRGFHAYDNMQSRFFISYQMPLRRTMNDGAGEVSVSYPLRFSVGIEQQSFTNFAGPGASQWRPAFRITVF